MNLLVPLELMISIFWNIVSKCALHFSLRVCVHSFNLLFFSLATAIWRAITAYHNLDGNKHTIFSKVINTLWWAFFHFLILMRNMTIGAIMLVQITFGAITKRKSRLLSFNITIAIVRFQSHWLADWVGEWRQRKKNCLTNKIKANWFGPGAFMQLSFDTKKMVSFGFFRCNRIWGSFSDLKIGLFTINSFWISPLGALKARNVYPSDNDSGFFYYEICERAVSNRSTTWNEINIGFGCDFHNKKRKSELSAKKQKKITTNMQ